MTRPSIALSHHRNDVQAIIERYNVRNARVFGSVARKQDTDRSDLDIIVETTPETTLFDIGQIRHELQTLLGVHVDVLTEGALSPDFRNEIAREATPF